MKTLMMVMIVIGVISFMSCKKPYFQFEQPPFVLKEYYQGGGIGDHAQWWWNVFINGKQLQLPDGKTDFKEIDLGLSKDPPCLVVKSDLNIYLIRILKQEIDIILIPENIRGPYGWTDDGLGYVTKKGWLNVQTGKTENLPEFPGDFLGFSPDKRFIISSEFITPNIHLHQTDINTGDTKFDVFSIAEYKWLNEWTHFQKPHYAPNVWIFSRIRWNKKDNGAYEMIVPKQSEIKMED